ncbi:MAG TPA: prephenate/arogenate dehydrogenase family protein [Hyphomicrobiales bacterium]|nr:prephenate/arogenate dehydrogenase family protein [Hyphomicrobiales bacterium]
MAAVTDAPPFERLAVIGVGLIGGSAARAAREFGLAKRIAVYDASPAAQTRLKALGFADEVADSAAAAVRGADAVIVAVPPGACGPVAKEIAPALQPGAIISDVSSVKAAVIAAMGRELPDGIHFVPAHPVAGTEESGPDAGFATLFAGRWCILTPPPGTDPDAILRMAAFWRGTGSNVEIMTPEHHDLVLAITSHVPHLIAYNIVGTAADLEQVTQSEVIKFSAGGFRDFTRIAASDPTMWRDVFLLNRDAVLEMLGRFVEDLTALQRSIRWGDGDALFQLFTRTRAIRRGIIAEGQDAPGVDFGRPHRAPEPPAKDTAAE